MFRPLPIIVVAALGVGLAACGGQSGDKASSSPASTAQDYVRAINARDGETVCALLTEDAVNQLRLPADDLPCARAVTSLIGYVEDSGSPEFLRYESTDTQSGSEDEGLRSVRLSLEARFQGESEGGAFEICRFNDVLWLKPGADGWRIAKPSAALYAAFGVAQFPAEILDPPGIEDGGAYLGRSELLRCRPVLEPEAAPSAGSEWNVASIAGHLAENESHFTDVRCVEAAGHDGWDFVCTYHDQRLGKRMKIAVWVTANGKALVSSGSVPEDSWLPPRS